MLETETPPMTVKRDELGNLRRKRILQIGNVTSVGLGVCLFVARGVTFDIFALSLISILFATLLAYKFITSVSTYLLLGSLSSMLFALAATGAGIFDMAMLGYPGVIIFAALLGGRTLFAGVLSFVLAQCALMTWLIMGGTITPHSPFLSWSHLVFIMVIFCVIGFGVYVLVQDIRRLMVSLQQENAKVEQNRIHIQHLAHHDPLTNLPNRILGERLFSEKLEESEQKGLQLALLFIDLDNFKPVNDALGHAAGDRFLQKISQTITDNLSVNERLIRFGGDEFIILASEIQDKSQIDSLCHNLISWCSSEFEVLQTKIVVSCSIGIAQAPYDGIKFKQLCRKADIAMYEAKRNGRNRFEYYDAKFDKESDEKFKLIQRLRPAVANGELEVYYQPLVDLASGHICSVEALVRWPQADGTVVSPHKFIPLAESSGLITPLGEWVLNESCEFCAQQHQLGNTDLTIAVNLSFAQFKDGSLPKAVAAALEKSGLTPGALELELTESILAESTNNVTQQLDYIKALGVKFAIDDFGTGYSNLNYLRTFSAHKLKIDRIFVKTLGLNKNEEPLVSGIINMAKSLGMVTVAEGIENEAALAKLIELGCNIGQGYYWSKPVRHAEIKTLLYVNRQRAKR
ncbi:putative bifunctional diguanylate cyclase/phosphodiesterase [Alteromonas gracilis]|uniref:putative bifunctional diguanylate cyclase/phosphodiesterase n=1 Tax=Alteromonas gracilis TaxID=1479524 RepID=UPI003219815D